MGVPDGKAGTENKDTDVEKSAEDESDANYADSKEDTEKTEAATEKSEKADPPAKKKPMSKIEMRIKDLETRMKKATDAYKDTHIELIQEEKMYEDRLQTEKMLDRQELEYKKNVAQFKE